MQYLYQFSITKEEKHLIHRQTGSQPDRLTGRETDKQTQVAGQSASQQDTQTDKQGASQTDTHTHTVPTLRERFILREASPPEAPLSEYSWFILSRSRSLSSTFKSSSILPWTVLVLLSRT